MKGPASMLVVALGSLLTGGVAARVVATRMWDRATARDVARLAAGARAVSPPYAHDELARLPAPVVRYFEFALTPGQPVVRTARFEQSGSFAMRAGRWSPFSAAESFAVEPPGFVWDATIRVAAVVPFDVRDGYAGGSGALTAMLAGIVPVANLRATPEMASGELSRYLAEAVLLPTALLPRGGISWQPLSNASARVTLADGPTTVSCDVDFGRSGEIVRVAAMRDRTIAGRFVSTPWTGRWSEYRRVSGMMVPMSGEAAWILPDGPFPYWRGRISRARYGFAFKAMERSESTPNPVPAR